MRLSNFEDAQVHVVRSDRKTVSIQIKPDGIYVRAPRRMTNGEVLRLLEGKRTWIRKHLQIAAERAVNSESFTRAELEDLAALRKRRSCLFRII